MLTASLVVASACTGAAPESSERPSDRVSTEVGGVTVDGQAKTDLDGDDVLDCAPGVSIHGHAGFMNIGDPALTKAGALTNYLAGKSAKNLPVVASDFSQHSVGVGGGVLWVSNDHQVFTTMEQGAQGEWYVAGRSACSDIFDK